MIHGKRLVVIMPAYNAEKTLRQTLDEIPPGFVDEVVLVDDASRDRTAELAESLGLLTIRHDRNRGYGGNQKTCYRAALERGADVVVMLHPDYQYSPKLVVAMASMLAVDQYDVVLASRILGGSAIRGGMPVYKYVSNRFLTAVQNLIIGAKLSEYHTGYRGFNRRTLQTLPLDENDDDFVFDNQMVCQAHYAGLRIGEISCPAKYEPQSSSISFRRSCKYGLGVLSTALRFRLAKWGLRREAIFDPNGRRLGNA